MSEMYTTADGSPYEMDNHNNSIEIDVESNIYISLSKEDLESMLDLIQTKSSKKINSLPLLDC
jgi:hypothetical protein